MIQQRLDMNESTDLTQAILTDYYEVQEQVQTKQSVSVIYNQWIPHETSEYTFSFSLVYEINNEYIREFSPPNTTLLYS